MSAEREFVLSQQSVSRIQFYVKHKFSHLPHERHAEIVADAIIKIIERQLPAFSEQTKKKITTQLIAEVVVPQKRPVSLQDIQKVCREHVTSINELDLLHKWEAERFTISAPLQHELTETALRHKKVTLSKRRYISLLYTLGCILIIAATALFVRPTEPQASPTSESAGFHNALIEENAALLDLPANELPASLQYKEIHIESVKSYLETRNSILVEEPYFTSIYDAAKAFNIHPLLLFAITGQEQGFVSRDHPQVEKIANNPFNVFHSWEDYNTTIEDSAAIAARTIVNLSKDRPEHIDAIAWINRKYAEDPNWSVGVQSLFETLMLHNLK